MLFASIVERKNLWIASASVVAIFLHLILRWSDVEWLGQMLLVAILLVGGTALLVELFRQAFRGEIGADFLAGISIVVAFMLGEYLAGSIVILMLSGGQALEAMAIGRASAVLKALAARIPENAHRKVNDRYEEVPVGSLTVGDLIALHPHEVCPIDGVVSEGAGGMNESYLTGEAFLVKKSKGSAVLSGAINGDAPLLVTVTAPATDSRYSRLLAVLHSLDDKKPKIRRLADRLGGLFTPFALIVATLAGVYSSSLKVFLAVLVVATPCPLLIAIPVCLIGAVALAARRGIVIKNPSILEELPRCQTIIFDKTGTLTYGEPVLSSEVLFGSISGTEALRLAATLEQYSKHPLAKPLIQGAKERSIELSEASEVHEPPGRGLRGIIEGISVEVTGRKHFISERENQEALPKTEAGLECLLLINGKLAALYRFHDRPKVHGREFISHLSKRHGYQEIMLLTGDRAEEAEALGAALGIGRIVASASPEQKLQIVQDERRRGSVVFVGDGINDAPALMAATVGISFGESDAPAEAAAAVILDGSLERLDELFHISSRMRRIALQSAVGGLLLSIIGMCMAAFGLLQPVSGAILQEGIDVLAVMNALRVAQIPAKLIDYK